MRKLVLALSALLLLITPALAREPEEAAMPDFGAQALEQALDGQTREALGDVSAASVGDFATQLWNIVTDALSNANLALRSALFSAGKVLQRESCAPLLPVRRKTPAQSSLLRLRGRLPSRRSARATHSR